MLLKILFVSLVVILTQAKAMHGLPPDSDDHDLQQARHNADHHWSGCGQRCDRRFDPCPEFEIKPDGGSNRDRYQ